MMMLTYLGQSGISLLIKQLHLQVCNTGVRRDDDDDGGDGGGGDDDDDDDNDDILFASGLHLPHGQVTYCLVGN